MGKKYVNLYVDEDQWDEFTAGLSDKPSAAVNRLISAEIRRNRYRDRMYELIDSYLPCDEPHAVHRWYLGMVQEVRGESLV